MKYDHHGQTKTIRNLCAETGADTTAFLSSIGELPFSQSHSRLVENMFLRTSITDKVRSPIPGSGNVVPFPAVHQPCVLVRTGYPADGWFHFQLYINLVFLYI